MKFKVIIPFLITVFMAIPALHGMNNYGNDDDTPTTPLNTYFGDTFYDIDITQFLQQSPPKKKKVDATVSAIASEHQPQEGADNLYAITKRPLENPDESEQPKTQKTEFEKICPTCHKEFRSKPGYLNHIESKKCKNNVGQVTFSLNTPTDMPQPTSFKDNATQLQMMIPQSKNQKPIVFNPPKKRNPNFFQKIEYTSQQSNPKLDPLFSAALEKFKKQGE